MSGTIGETMAITAIGGRRLLGAAANPPPKFDPNEIRTIARRFNLNERPDRRPGTPLPTYNEVRTAILKNMKPEDVRKEIEAAIRSGASFSRLSQLFPNRRLVIRKVEDQIGIIAPRRNPDRLVTPKIAEKIEEVAALIKAGKTVAEIAQEIPGSERVLFMAERKAGMRALRVWKAGEATDDEIVMCYLNVGRNSERAAKVLHVSPERIVALARAAGVLREPKSRVDPCAGRFEQIKGAIQAGKGLHAICAEFGLKTGSRTIRRAERALGVKLARPPAKKTPISDAAIIDAYRANGCNYQKTAKAIRVSWKRIKNLVEANGIEFPARVSRKVLHKKSAART